MRGFSAEGVRRNPDDTKGRLCQAFYFANLPIGAVRVMDGASRDVSSVIISVKQGTLDCWIGDFGGDGVPLIPQFHVLSGTDRQYWFPPGPYRFTVASTGVAPLEACVTLLG